MIRRIRTSDRCDRDHADRDRGAVGLDWFIMLPVFVGALLVLVALPQWPERQGAARAAAAEAARFAVLADTRGEMRGAAENMAQQVMNNYGYDGGQFSVAVDGELERGTSITVSVTVRMPAIAVPFGADLATADYTASATERVEDYRGIEP